MLAAVCMLMLRGLDKSGFAATASVCFGVIFALAAVLCAKPVLEQLVSIGGLYLGDAHADILRRGLAVGITVQLTADTVRDAGEGGLADRVETVGRAVLLCIGIPLYKELFSLAGQFFGM